MKYFSLSDQPGSALLGIQTINEKSWQYQVEFEIRKMKMIHIVHVSNCNHNSTIPDWYIFTSFHDIITTTANVSVYERTTLNVYVSQAVSLLRSIV